MSEDDDDDDDDASVYKAVVFTVDDRWMRWDSDRYDDDTARWQKKIQHNIIIIIKGTLFKKNY